MSTIIDTLITNRTQADVERVKALAAKGFAGMTAAEQAEWLAGMKGAYNAADLNRVETALNYLAGRLGAICGMSIAHGLQKPIGPSRTLQRPHRRRNTGSTYRTSETRSRIPPGRRTRRSWPA